MAILAKLSVYVLTDGTVLHFGLEIYHKYIIKQIELLRKAGRPAGPRIGKRRTRKDGKP